MPEFSFDSKVVAILAVGEILLVAGSACEIYAERIMHVLKSVSSKSLEKTDDQESQEQLQTLRQALLESYCSIAHFNNHDFVRQMLAYLNEMTDKGYLRFHQKDYQMIPELYGDILANMSQPHNRGPLLKEILDDTILYKKVSVAVEQIHDAQVQSACRQSLHAAWQNASNFAVQFQ